MAAGDQRVRRARRRPAIRVDSPGFRQRDRRSCPNGRAPRFPIAALPLLSLTHASRRHRTTRNSFRLYPAVSRSGCRRSERGDGVCGSSERDADIGGCAGSQSPDNTPYGPVWPCGRSVRLSWSRPVVPNGSSLASTPHVGCSTAPSPGSKARGRGTRKWRAATSSRLAICDERGVNPRNPLQVRDLSD
jgi:hypothetical protein